MARIGETADLLKCSFCDKSQKQVKKLIAGPGVYICDECIDLCNEIIEEELAEGAELSFGELPKPHEIFDFLGGYVIGQDAAKESLAVAVYNHYKRVQAQAATGRSKDDGVELAKSNILLVGPPAAARPTSRRRWPACSTCRSPSPTPPPSPRPAMSVRTSRTSSQAHPGRRLRRQEGRDGHHLHR